MEVTQQTLDMLKKTFGDKGELQKATIQVSTGLVAVDLQAPAKNLYPVITVLSQKIPRVPGAGGTATQWKVVNSITGSGYEASPWIPEGQRAGQMGMNVTPASAGYVTIGEEAGVTFEAVSAGRGFEDVQASSTMRLLQKVMRKQELAILGGNKSLNLGVSATPTLAASGSGGTLGAATYSVICVQLTFEGWKNYNAATKTLATQTTVTGADGQTYTLKGGSGNKSAAASQAITLGQNLVCNVAVTPGALAFAWFVGTAGNEKLEAVTTVPTATFSAPLAGTGQAAAAITADNSANAGAWDGLLAVALNPSNNAYVKAMNGATLTSSGRQSVVEIDVMLKAMWDNYNLSPTVLYVSSQELQNISNKVLTGTSTSTIRQVNNLQDPTAIVAGNVVAYYFNPYSLNGGIMIPVLLHPDLPQGTIMGYAENLPVQYQSADVPNVAEMHVQDEMHMYDWPVTTRQYTKGVYCREVLAVYAPFAIGLITGIGNG